MANPEAIIVGGGPAGSAAAITLARAGVAVTLLERETQPVNKVCGEFLSEEAVDILSRLDIPLDTLAAPAISRLRVSKSNRSFEIPLPFRAQTLTRLRLDEDLLRKAKSLGVHIMHGQHVTGIHRDGDAWIVLLRSGERLTAANVLLATGKHDIPGMPRPPGKQNNLVGLKQYFRLRPDQHQALAAHIELHFFPGGYAGLQLVEDGTANLCCVAKASSLTKGAHRWSDLLKRMKQNSALLSERLDGVTACEERPMAIAPIPYGMVQPVTSEGLWLLGDQAAVIPSFTGDGMSIALHSGVLAAAALLAGKSSKAYQASFADAVRSQVNLATWISRRMVRPLEQDLAATLLRVSPNLLSWLANKTRLPQSLRQSALHCAGQSLTSAASSSAQYETARA